MTPQQQQIYTYLEDGDWHCMTHPGFFMKDDRKRISELNQMGFIIEGKPCDGRCGIRHTSKVLMRRLVTSHTINEF